MSKWKRLQKRSVIFSDDDLRLAGEPENWRCIDCDVDTAPGSPDRAQMKEDFRREGRSRMVVGAESEVYYVHGFIWERAGMKVGKGNSNCLCIGCLEKRIGRELTPIDFDHDHPFFRLPGTERMLRRQGRWHGYEVEVGDDEPAPAPSELERALNLISAHEVMP
jgi:hypothetical protein